jgi:predicted transcriptional regulator
MTPAERRKREDVVLLSIDSRFADQIYSGEKEYEFRKTPLPNGIEYVVLMENGTRKVTGGFTIKDVHEESVPDLWEKYGQDLSEEDRFFSYYSSWDRGLAIEIDTPEQYEEPLDVSDLENTDPGLKVPDRFHFVYIPNQTLRRISSQSNAVSKLLPDSKETTLDRYASDHPNEGDLNFRPMESSEEEEFRELFSKSPVPDDYADISQGFIDHIIESHNLGEDPFGYFTLKKKVYSLFANEELIGFTTITKKRGGSVKFGPTMIKESERGKGYGPKLRKLIDSDLRHSGIRKTYSTIPETASNAFKYLISSGYKVEAHLHKQYTEDHSELVFGKVLQGENPPDNANIYREQVEEVDFEIGSDKVEDFQMFVKERAEPWYDEIDDSFVNSVQQAEERGLESEFSKKGKRVYIGHQNAQTSCIAISSKKRGDSVKVSPIFSSISGESLTEFIDFFEEDIEQAAGARKVYTHIPTLDSELHTILRQKNYQCEGVIREPYKPGIDMLVMAKMLK